MSKPDPGKPATTETEGTELENTDSRANDRGHEGSGAESAAEHTFEILPDEMDGAGGAAASETVPQEAEPSADDRLAMEVKALRVERDRLYEAWLRATADFDNYRKRTEREKEEFRQYAVENLLRQMLPVLDNFERALESLPPGAPRAFADGVNLIYKQLRDSLHKYGLTPMESLGEIFDPHLHEAVETDVRSDAAHHEILEEVQKGYRLGQRVLRPAMVKVCVRTDEDRGPAEHETAEDPS